MAYAVLTDIELVSSPFYRWQKHGDSEYTVTTGMDIYTLRDYLVTSSFLAAQHPDLPETLAALFDYRVTSLGLDLLYTQEVLATIDLLREKIVTLTSTIGFDVLLCDLQSINPYKNSELKMEVKGRCISEVPHFFNNKNFRVALSSTYQTVFVTRFELERRFPGWEKRWHLCTELGYLEQDAIKHVFMLEPKISTLSLPNGLDFSMPG